LIIKNRNKITTIIKPFPSLNILYFIKYFKTAPSGAVSHFKFIIPNYFTVYMLCKEHF